MLACWECVCDNIVAHVFVGLHCVGHCSGCPRMVLSSCFQFFLELISKQGVDTLCNLSAVFVRQFARTFTLLCMTLHVVTPRYHVVLDVIVELGDRALVLDETSLVSKSCFAAAILLFVSLSRRTHPRYTRSTIRIGSSRSTVLISFFHFKLAILPAILISHARKLIEVRNFFDAYRRIPILVLFPFFFTQNFCEFSFPQ